MCYVRLKTCKTKQGGMVVSTNTDLVRPHQACMWLDILLLMLLYLILLCLNQIAKGQNYHNAPPPPPIKKWEGIDNKDGFVQLQHSLVPSFSKSQGSSIIIAVILVRQKNSPLGVYISQNERHSKIKKCGCLHV